MSGEVPDKGQSDFEDIIAANYSLGDGTGEGVTTYFSHVVDLMLDNRFNGGEGVLNSFRTEAAEVLLDGGIVSTMEDGLAIVDSECQRRIKEMRRARHDGQA